MGRNGASPLSLITSSYIHCLQYRAPRHPCVPCHAHAQSFLLSQCLMTPINGRVSDVIGRKWFLYGSIIVFLAFSAMCGGAKTMNTLIVARAFAGLGGGSIISLT